MPREFYFGREFELDAAWRLLQDHQDLLLVGPRRIGKTTLCRHVQALAETEGWRTAMVDISGCADEEEVMRAIEAATNGWWEHLKDIWNRTDLTIGDWHASTSQLPWAERGRARCRALAEHRHGALLILDEAPVFLKRLLDLDRNRGERWAQTLRSWRQQSMGMRFVLAGSIGLNTLAERYKITTSINDLTPLPLPAFDDLQADAFLQAYALHHGFQIDEAARRRLLAHIGWHVPKHHIELIRAAQQANRSHDLSGLDSIDAGQAALLAQKGNFLQHWQDRLEDYGKNDAVHLRTLLGLIAKTAEGVQVSRLGPASELQKYYLDLLDAEGYIVPITRNGRACYAFRSALVRAWWVRS